MKNLKPHELLKHAYENYQLGVKFTPFIDKGTYTSSGKFHLHEDDFNAISDEDNGQYIFEYGKWAEIVKPKIAVKVENEKEFKALMKYYDSLGYYDWDEDKPLSIKYPLYYNEDIVSFEDRFVFPSNGVCKAHFKNVGTKYDLNTYQIIPFDEFAKKHGIKLPLLTSEDGVYLYDGDEFWHVMTNHNELGFINPIKLSQEEVEILSNSEIDKAFSTKDAALSWIEVQKPKEIVLEFGAYKFTIKNDSVNVSHGDSDTFIDIKSICKAIEELKS